MVNTCEIVLQNYPTKLCGTTTSFFVLTFQPFDQTNSDGSDRSWLAYPLHNCVSFLLGKLCNACVALVHTNYLAAWIYGWMTVLKGVFQSNTVKHEIFLPVKELVLIDKYIYTKHQILVIITILLMLIEIALHSFLFVLQWAVH